MSSSRSKGVILPLALCFSMLAAASWAQGTQPSLDHLPGKAPEAGITPISDIIGGDQPVAVPVPEEGPEMPALKLDLSGESPAPAQKPIEKSDEKSGEKPDISAETPAVDVTEAPKEPIFNFGNAMNRLGFSYAKPPQGNFKPVSYSPLPGIVVFPVVKHGREKAFGDLPLMFAREYAERMELKAPETKVYNPIYTVDEIRMRGMGHIYDKIMDYYIKAGRPEPMAMDYLLKQLTQNDKQISRVVFVEADLDMNHPDEATGVIEKMVGWSTDGTPKQMKYFVRSRLQVFDAENPNFPMVWGGSWSRSIKTNQFYNVTASVFADSDSQQAFSRVSRQMSRELLIATPAEVYMEPLYDASVQGKLVSGNGKEPTFQNFSETKTEQRTLMTEDHRKAIQRILQRQNSISP